MGTISDITSSFGRCHRDSYSFYHTKLGILVFQGVKYGYKTGRVQKEQVTTVDQKKFDGEAEEPVSK